MKRSVTRSRLSAIWVEFYSTIGRKPYRLRDWLFGSTAKRLLLAALVAEPDRRWTKAELARRASVHTKGGVDDHVAALIQMGVLRRHENRYELVRSSTMIDPVRAMLEALEAVPDAPIAAG